MPDAFVRFLADNGLLGLDAPASDERRLGENDGGGPPRGHGRITGG